MGVAVTDTFAPKVFVSHASEDKARFVSSFSLMLRARGIDAWVDQWEIKAGDSLVSRIFDEGIDQADAFLVVLSRASVSKPWVREELDAAVVRRIQSERAKRIIPIVLDDGVDVPPALRHLKWCSVPRDGLDRVAEEVTSAVFGFESAPPLGERPRYTATAPVWTSDPQDETVFRLLVDELRAHDAPGWMLFTDDVQARAAEEGIGADQFAESMGVLIQSRQIVAEEMAGGARWLLRPLPDRLWLRLESERGLDVDSARTSILADVVNLAKREFAAGDCGLGWHTLSAVLRLLDAEGMLSVHEVLGGRFTIARVSPLARRALR